MMPAASARSPAGWSMAGWRPRRGTGCWSSGR
jgi:hypothetical protein